MNDRLVTRTELFALFASVAAIIVAAALASAELLEWIDDGVSAMPAAYIFALSGVAISIDALLVRRYIKMDETGGGVYPGDPLGIGSRFVPSEDDDDE